MEKEVITGPEIVELSFLGFKIRGRQNRIHNVTIIIGFVVCMMAGGMVVSQELKSSTNPIVRVLRTARAGRKRNKENYLDTCFL